MYAGFAGIQGVELFAGTQGVALYAGIQGVGLYAVQGVGTGDVCSWGLCLCYNGRGCGPGEVPRPRAEGDINNALTPPPLTEGFPGLEIGEERNC